MNTDQDTPGPGPEMTALLHKAATYRALSLLFAPPSDSIAEELRALGRELGGRDREAGDALSALGREAGAELSALYHSALGPTGAVRDSESDYEVNPLGGKGPLLADVSGFYLAFKFEDPSLDGMSPDHLSMELSFLGWLAFRQAFARHSRNADGEVICREASEKFVSDHLGRWLSTFALRVAERCPETWYHGAAAFTLDRIAALEPGRLAAPTQDPRKVKLPMAADEGDEIECGLPPDM
jgi:hypothetical protein